MSATMRHLNPLWCPQLTHKVCAPAGRLGLAERANGLVLEPREQALGVKEVATGRDAARAVELVSANRAARAHRAGRRTATCFRRATTPCLPKRDAKADTLAH